MNKQTNKSPLGKPKKGFSPSWIYLPILAILLSMLFFKQGSNQKEVSWNEFKRIAQTGAVEKIIVKRQDNSATAQINPTLLDSAFTKQELRTYKQSIGITPTTKYEVTTVVPSVDKFSDFYDQSGLTLNVIYQNKSFSLTSLLINWGPLLLLIIFWIFIFRSMNPAGKGGTGGGLFNVGKSKAKLYDRSKVNVTFKDVAGLHEAKQELEEIVSFLRNPEKFTHLGGKIPKGALLVGPPGTGKTLFAKAIAGEANVPFFSISGSDFVEMFVGVGASRVRDLFTQAKEKAPCIIFIDEIDAVGRARSKNAGFGGNDERENTLNQLLTEMDGFDTNSGVIIVAATNRVDILDKALLRAGRFDRQIMVDLPDINDRKDIFLVHMKKLKLAQDVNAEHLAKQTPGFSGADIANVCNEAALIAARRDKKAIEKIDFMDAVDRIIGGLEKRNKITTEEERESIAIHEAGHATISWKTQYGSPLVKVTIVPRGKALGAAWYMPEERQITHTQVLLDEMCSLLGGRAAEELFLKRISTGAANDLERVTKLAYAMVAYYGMSEKLPNLNYYDAQNDGYSFQKPYSEARASLIDQEVSRIVSEQYIRAKQILQDNANGHHQLADTLIRKEVIYAEDMEEIFGKRPWLSRTDELLALQEKETKEDAVVSTSVQESSEKPNPSLSSTEEETN